ncbi:SAM-dependent methyltransferase [Mycobacterium alsense]|uniref:SAM-dependent methyltransferase n=1 Tax=Mycobacterium alsense TaxID=324058 RepID=A0AA41XM86_9MYCO|nr:class I SAM-dependent methyltransferase [Mycobacterium alsense]MCV7378853.1 class I SAM-dependent methyltransferase [Mycobacterium alsense]OQZ91759.1 SAM-dependent methyltransferase [Mycobacterium alsense]
MGFVTKNHPHDYLPAAGHDALLPGYDLLSRLLGMGGVHERLIAQAELAGCRRILEIGCGTGNLIIRAKREHPEVEAAGCDPDPRALEWARRKDGGRSGIRFEQGYAERLPYADGEFDRVLSSMMLHHIDPGARAAAAEEIFRVLRPGGRLHLVDIGGDAATDGGVVTRLIRRNHHVAGNLGDAIPRLLNAAGFECAEVATHRQRVVGRLTYYRATRPA